MEFEVDPLFGKNSIKFDEMGVRGLLINNIQIDQNLQMKVQKINYLFRLYPKMTKKRKIYRMITIGLELFRIGFHHKRNF